MIHPTRTNLLQLKERAASIANSVSILKARRRALIQEFITSVYPFLRSRDSIRAHYARALTELALAEGHEGTAFIETLAASSARDIGVDVAEKNVMGVRYRDLTLWGPLQRSPAERNYGYAVTSPHLEESIHFFEKTAEGTLEIAAFENKLETLAREIQHVTRRIRVLEERILPALRVQIRAIALYLAEREREAQFRLRRFKNLRAHTST